MSGCTDSTLSYETIDPELNSKCGALSFQLRVLLKERNWILSVNDLIIGITNKMKNQTNYQSPVLTMSFDPEPNELIFVNPQP